MNTESDNGASGVASPSTKTWKRLIRFGFRLLYNELSWSYDAVSWIVSLGKWRDWQKTAIPYLAGSRVLEIAHGPGHILLDLQESGYQAFGIDLSASMIGLARRRIENKGVEVPLVQGSAMILPYRSETFDSVLMTFPTDFVIYPETIRGVHRILRSNGRLVILPDARLTGTGPIFRFIEWLFIITGQRKTARMTSVPGKMRQQLSILLEESGFAVEPHLIKQDDSEIVIILALK